MTNAERIAARIASNKMIDEKVDKGQVTEADARDFSKLGRAFLESLPDMAKGTEAASLLELARRAKGKT
jgi:hypothetical protein